MLLVFLCIVVIGPIGTPSLYSEQYLDLYLPIRWLGNYNIPHLQHRVYTVGILGLWYVLGGDCGRFLTFL